MPPAPAQPRPLPELDDELREDWIRRNTIAERNALALGRTLPRYGSPATLEAGDAMAATPANSQGLLYAPVLGPALDFYNDARHHRGGAASVDVGLGLLDAFTAGSLASLEKVAAKGALKGALARPASFTAREVRDHFRKQGVTKVGQQLHHIWELRGFPRDLPSLKNNPLLMKPLDLAKHRRIHTGWAGADRYDPIRRFWIGTHDWMKAVPAWLAAHGVDMASDRSAEQAPPRPPPLISGPTNPPPQPAARAR